MVFHVVNRGVGRMRLFLKAADFERMIEKTLASCPRRICGCCLMSNHVWCCGPNATGARVRSDLSRLFAPWGAHILT
jgi:REP element-mobilizing transposase RayT